MRILLELLQPHRKVLALGLVLGLLANAATLASPLATKRIIDTLGTGASLLEPVLFLLVLVVAGAVISLTQWILLGKLAERVVLEARVSILKRYFAARVAALTRRPTGELVTRVTSDTQLLHEASSSIVGLINAGVAFLATLVLMGTLDLVLLGATLTAVLVVGAVMAVLLPTIGKAQLASQESVGRLGGELEGTLRAIRTVKAARAEDRLTTRLVAGATEAAGHNIRAARRAAWVWTVSWTGIQLAILVVLGLGAWRAELGLLEVSSLIAFLLYAFQLMGPITELTQNLTALQSGTAAAARLREVRSLPIEATLPAAATPPAASSLTEAPLLELRGVGWSPGVREVSLTLPRHGHVAIVGPSGAGKTSLFGLMLRFLEPDSGELLLNGRPYRDLTHDEIRSYFGYVEQDTPVVPGTIRDNLTFNHPAATPDEIARALHAVRLDAITARLDEPLSDGHVSGGERQRIALARTLVREPRILLLDEATAQLDGLTEAALQESILRCARTGTVVTIAHRLSTALDADHIIVLEDGRIRAEGTHRSLLASDDLYRELVEALRIAVEPAPAGA